MGNRIKKSEVYENRFYRIPKAFFKTDKYKKLSLHAKVIYGFLDDRRELSLKNNWVDADDNIYLIFTREEVEEMLCLSDKTVTKAFKQLKEYGLIEELIQGLNKPNLIYVCHIDFENIEDMRIRNISDSRTIDNTIQESDNLRSIDTELNKTNLNKTEKGLHQLSEIDGAYIDGYIKVMGEYGYRHKGITDSNYDSIRINIAELETYVDYDTFVEEVDSYFNALYYGHKNGTNNNDGDINCFFRCCKRMFDVEIQAN